MMINGKWIRGFLSTLRRLELVDQPSQAVFRPSFMPTIDNMALRLSWIHLKKKDEDGKIEEKD